MKRDDRLVYEQEGRDLGLKGKDLREYIAGCMSVDIFPIKKKMKKIVDKT